jgi:hypothetical protein
MMRASKIIGLVPLAGWSWFECRYCSGLFIIGPSHQQSSTRVEDRAAHQHEAKCADRTDDDGYTGGDDEDDGSEYFRHLTRHDVQKKG